MAWALASLFIQELHFVNSIHNHNFNVLIEILRGFLSQECFVFTATKKMFCQWIMN
jgi:hypothetical protein